MIEFYGILYNKIDILPGYLVEGINEQSGLAIRWPAKKAKAYIFQDNILTVNDILQIKPKTINYSLKYSSFYSEL